MLTAIEHSSNGAENFEKLSLKANVRTLENFIRASNFQHMLKIISPRKFTNTTNKKKFNVGKSRIFPHYLNEKIFFILLLDLQVVAVEIRIEKKNKNITE